MFNPTAVVIGAFVEELKRSYIETYTNLEPDYPGIIAYVGNMALELIANSDISRAAGVWRQLREQPKESRSRVRYRLTGTALAGDYGRVPFDRSGEIDLKSDSFRRKPAAN